MALPVQRDGRLSISGLWQAWSPDDISPKALKPRRVLHGPWSSYRTGDAVSVQSRGGRIGISGTQSAIAVMLSS